MAFNQVNLKKLANLWGLVNPTDPTPGFYVYQASLLGDSKATVAAAGYFNGAVGVLEGDLIYAMCTDGPLMLNVSAVSAAGVVTFSSQVGSASGQSITVTADDTIATGLAGALAVVVATLDDDPSLTCAYVSANIGTQAGAPAAGSFYLKTWMPTSNANPTPIAATTFGKKVNWVAYLA